MVQLSYEPNRVVLVLFDDPYSGENQAYRIEGVPVRVLVKEDLVALRCAFGRSQGLRGIAELGDG